MAPRGGGPRRRLVGVPDRPEPQRRRKPNDGYQLRIESITYQGDDTLGARAIQEFLRLRRLGRTRERAVEIQPDNPGSAA